MTRSETLVAGNGERVQCLDSQRLCLLEEPPRVGLGILDEDLSKGRRTRILPLVCGGEEAS